MMILGILLMLHGTLVEIGTVGGIIGYLMRKKLADAIGIGLTVGVAALVEVITGLFLIF